MTSTTDCITIEDAEAAFSQAVAEKGYGEHDIPADGVWYNFAFPDNSGGHESGSAKLTVANGSTEGVIRDFRRGKSPIFTWKPGARVAVDDEYVARMAAAAAEKRAEREQARLKAVNEFAKFPPATADHAYLVRKGITDPTPLKLDGDALVVPIYNASTGELRLSSGSARTGRRSFRRVPRSGAVARCRAAWWG